MSVKFDIKPFDELTSVDIYHILRARVQVFVVEQKCAYQEVDGLDFDCLHVVAHEDFVLVGYCRIIPATAYAEDISRIAEDIAEYDAEYSIENTAIEGNSASTSNGHIGKLTIGRVLVLPEHRGDGLARKLVQQAIHYCHKHYKKQPIHVSAQTYLIGFYESLGFETAGTPYYETGIEHINMVLGNTKRGRFGLAVLGETSGSKKILILVLIVLIIALVIAGLVYLKPVI